MSTHPPDDGARLVRTEVELPGTPESVWRAIATGPGMTAWFTPAEVDEHEGGRVVTHHGPYGSSQGTVTTWDPPHRFAYVEREWLPDEDVPPWSTEILVQARAGGTCVVRLVSGFERDGGPWEDQLDGTDEGWRWGLHNLRLYLAYFAGQPAANLWALGTVPGDRDAAHAELTRALGLVAAAPGDAFRAPPDAPPLAGTVEVVEDYGLQLRSVEPWPGSFNVNTWLHGGVVVSVRAYLYGDGGAELARPLTQRWQAWLAERFPTLAPVTAPTPT